MNAKIIIAALVAVALAGAALWYVIGQGDETRNSQDVIVQDPTDETEESILVEDVESIPEPSAEVKPGPDVSPAGGTAGLVDSSWSWQYTDLLGGERMNAPAGDRFILSFDGAGRVSSRTDCNGMGGRYVIDGEVLSMGQFVQTLMYCEGSMEGAYGEQLGLVNSYVIEGDTLRFNLNRDYGTMIFKRH